MIDVFDDARAERARAHAKHASNSTEAEPWDDPRGKRLRVLLEEVGEVAKELNDAEVELREPNPKVLRDELVQVMAMAGAWAHALDDPIAERDQHRPTSPLPVKKPGRTVVHPCALRHSGPPCPGPCQVGTGS